MRAPIAATFLLLPLAAPAAAQSSRLEMLQVVSSGFSGPGETVQFGRIRRALSRTPAVIARPGTTFAMTVKPVGEPTGAEVTLHWVWKAPRPGAKDKASGKLVRQVTQDAAATIGTEVERDYVFKTEDDIVRGNWRVEVWNGVRRLAVRRFAIK
jgi:hypothetical protein